VCAHSSFCIGLIDNGSKMAPLKLEACNFWKQNVALSLFLERHFIVKALRQIALQVFIILESFLFLILSLNVYALSEKNEEYTF
jgi:hypothetical protein